MIVAFALPHSPTGDSLATAATTAVDRGADALVIAEPSLGSWASAPQAAAFLATTLAVPVGVALDCRARHLLHIAADISVLHQFLFHPFFILSRLGPDDLQPLKSALADVTPPLLSFGSPIYIQADDVGSVPAIREAGFLALTIGPHVVNDATGIWVENSEISRLEERYENCHLCVLSGSGPDGAEIDAAQMMRLKYPREAGSQWLDIGLIQNHP